MTDFESLIRRLASGDVWFVVIGGFAGTMLGSPRTGSYFLFSVVPASLSFFLKGLPPKSVPSSTCLSSARADP